MSSDAILPDAAGNPAYYVRMRGKIHGPFDVEKLKKMYARGQFSRAHEVSQDKRSWQPASTLTELFSAPEKRIPQAGDNVFVAVDPDEEEVQLDVSEPPDTARWYYNVGDERHGPISLMDLRQLLLNGQVSPHDLVWKEGLADWVPIANQPEFQAQIGGGGRYQPHPHAMYGMAPGLSVDLPRTSGMAVASLTLGIIGLCLGPGAVLAVIFAGVSLVDIGRSRGYVTGRGLAIAGLVLGIVGIAFWMFWLLVWLQVVTSPWPRS